MALTKLEQLYRQIILDHSQSPRGFQKEIDATHVVTLKNRSCGDVVTLSLRIDNEQIVDATFSGSGCAISMASASMLMEEIRGASVVTARQKMTQFFALVVGEGTSVDLGDAAVLSGVSKLPARLKCATLSWEALRQLIETK